NILEVNQGACHMLGYTEEELLEMTADDLVPEGGSTFLPDQIEEATRTGGKLETVHLDKDGAEIPVDLRGKILPVDGEERVLISVRDISERKKREKRLKQYEMAVERSGDLMAALDEDYRYLFANRAYRNMYGMGKEEVQEKTVADLLGHATFHKRVKSKVDRCLEGETVEYEMWRKHPELGNRLLDIIYYPLRSGTKIHGFVAVMRDVTERKRFEEKLREANQRLKESRKRYQSYFEELGDAVYITKVSDGDDHGTILDVNPTAIDQTGYSRDELLDMKIFDLVVNSPDDLSYREIDELLDQDKPVSFTEKKVSKSGEEFWTEVVVTSIEHEGVDATLSINRDVTEKIRAQEELERERKRLRELHKAVDIFQSCQTEEDLYEATLQVTANVLEFDISIIFVRREDKLIPVASMGFRLKDLPVYDITEGLVGQTIQEDRTLWGEDVREVEGAQPEDPDLRSFLSVPIGNLGVFQAGARQPDEFTRSDVELTDILVGHLNEEIQRIRLEKKLKEKAIRDPLTGLYNRRYLNETLTKEIERGERYTHPISFLMIDINRFKEINDTYSHNVGDRVLEDIGKLLRENVRDTDTVFRYGGDEFLIMMPETNGEIDTTVDRLKRELKKWNESTNIVDFPITLAFGVSFWRPDKGTGIEEVIRLADERMYRDKKRTG
ncbi:PAS domain S-box protein, partial [Candidatus Bipolaricaulota bacterium]|nr:PAS domain S-box protein [Candidatus Bipolaricaulota bacterium]